MTARARWAVWGKKPGDHADYRLLAGSLDQRSLLVKLLRAYQPGTPDTVEPGHARSLPWVTVAPDETGAQTLLAVLGWSGDRDGTGRPITSTSVFLLPSSVVVACGHLALHQAALQQSLPPTPETQEVELRVDTAPVRRTRPEADWCAAVAALLLEGRVVITEPNPGDAADRLAVVDAVSRMLPAGYRAGLSVASWVNTPEQRPHRLCFGPYAEGDLAEVRRTAVPAPVSQPARRYLTLVRKYLKSDGEDKLAEYLGAQAGPFSFDDGTEAAVAIIAGLNVPDAVLAEIRAGRGDVSRTSQALIEYRPAAFGEDVETVYRFLLSVKPADDELLQLLAGCWTDALLPSVVAVARGSSKAHGGRLASAFVDPAVQAGDLDEYLTALISPDGREVPANLVQICVEVFVLYRDDYPRLCGLLRANAGVATSVVLECRDNHPDELVGMLRWLADGAQHQPPWLQVLLAAVADTDALPSDVVESAVRQSPPTAQIAFDIAASGGRLSALDDVLWRHLVRTISSRPDDPARQLLLASVTEAREKKPSPGDGAWLDLLLIAARQPPATVLSDADAARVYAATLHSGIETLSPVAPSLSHDRVAADVLRALLPDEASDHVVVAFVAVVLDRTQGRSLPKLAALLTDVLNTRRGVDLLPLLHKSGPGWRRFLLTGSALAKVTMDRAVRADLPDVLAECWAAVVVATQLPPQQPAGLHRLKSWAQLEEPDALAVLVRRTAWILSTISPHIAEPWYLATVDAVVRDHRLGRPAARAMAGSLRGVARKDEMRTRAEIDRLKDEVDKMEAQLNARKAEIRRLSETVDANHRYQVELGLDRKSGSSLPEPPKRSLWHRFVDWFSGGSM